MAATVEIYNNARVLAGTGALDLSTGNIRCLLVTSTYTPNLDTHNWLSDITNEVTGNGYARQTLTYGTVTRFALDTVTDRARFKSDNVEFTASGGSITARRAIFFKDTGVAGTSPLLFSVLIDNTPADVIAADGQKIRLTMNANGWLEI